MEQKNRQDSSSSKQHRIGFVSNHLQNPKMQAQFNIIDQYYKLMLQTSKTNQQLFQTLSYIKKSKHLNTSILIQKLLSIKNSINQSQHQIQTKQNSFHYYEISLHIQLIPKLYSRYLQKMRKRLLSITKFKQCLPETISTNLFHKLPTQQNLNNFNKLIKQLHSQNKQIYNFLINYLVENNLLVSIDQFQALGIAQISESEDDFLFEKVSSKKRSKRKKTEDDLPKIFIIDGYETIKTDSNHNRINGFQDSLVRNGELQPSQMDIKDIDFHQQQILNKQNNLLKVEQRKQFLQVEPKIRSRKASINEKIEQGCNNFLVEEDILKSSLTITKLKSKQMINLQQDVIKINICTQAEDVNFMKNSRGSKRVVGRKLNRFTLALKKPEISMEQNKSKRITTFDFKETHKLKKIMNFLREPQIDGYEKSEKSLKRIITSRDTKRQRKSSNQLTSKLIIHSCRISKNQTQQRKSNISNIQQRKLIKNSKDFKSSNQPCKTKSMRQIRKAWSKIQKIPLLPKQQSSHQINFSPQKNKLKTKTLLRTTNKSKFIASLFTQSNQPNNQPSFRVPRLVHKTLNLPLHSTFILQSTKLNDHNSLNPFQQQPYIKLSHHQRTRQSLHTKTIRPLQRFASESSKIFQIFSPRYNHIVPR